MSENTETTEKFFELQGYLFPTAVKPQVDGMIAGLKDKELAERVSMLATLLNGTAANTVVSVSLSSPESYHVIEQNLQKPYAKSKVSTGVTSAIGSLALAADILGRSLPYLERPRITGFDATEKAVLFEARIKEWSESIGKLDGASIEIAGGVATVSYSSKLPEAVENYLDYAQKMTLARSQWTLFMKEHGHNEDVAASLQNTVELRADNFKLPTAPVKSSSTSSKGSGKRSKNVIFTQAGKFYYERDGATVAGPCDSKDALAAAYKKYCDGVEGLNYYPSQFARTAEEAR